MIKSLINQINSFQTRDEIAQFLENEQSRGVRLDPEHCVIANWLRDKTNLDVNIDDKVYVYDPERSFYYLV